MNKLTILLSLPPKALSPNARVHYMARAKSAKLYREAGAWEAVSAMRRAKIRPPKAKKATVRYTAVHKVRRRRDHDNLIASMKPALDGLVDSGLLEDDSGVTMLPVVWETGEQTGIRIDVEWDNVRK